jgi:hypothetical protein
MYVILHAYTYVYTYIHTCMIGIWNTCYIVHTHIQTYVYTHIHTHTSHTDIYAHARTHTHTHTHVPEQALHHAQITVLHGHFNGSHNLHTPVFYTYMYKIAPTRPREHHARVVQAVFYSRQKMLFALEFDQMSTPRGQTYGCWPLEPFDYLRMRILWSFAR